MQYAIVIYLFGLGLVFGSFINALVWRLGQLLDSEGEPKKLSKIQAKQLSIATGRSICPNCRHRLAIKDLVPVFSWLSLKGRCRYCQKPISKQYPIVEATTALLFVISYLLWPYEFVSYEWIVFVGFLVALVCMLALAVYDIIHKILPSNLIYFGAILYFASLLLQALFIQNFTRLGQAALASLVFLTIFLMIFFMSYFAQSKGWSDKDWLGFGDVRLAVLLGLVVGEFFLVFVALFLASVIGLVFMLPSLYSKKANLASQIPFGPYLIAGSIVAFLIGANVIDTYINNMFVLYGYLKVL